MKRKMKMFNLGVNRMLFDIHPQETPTITVDITRRRPKKRDLQMKFT